MRVERLKKWQSWPVWESDTVLKTNFVNPVFIAVKNAYAFDSRVLLRRTMRFTSY